MPIQRGCDHRCTYCIVPYVRGAEKNRNADEVVREVRGLVQGPPVNAPVELRFVGNDLGELRELGNEARRIMAMIQAVDCNAPYRPGAA